MLSISASKVTRFAFFFKNLRKFASNVSETAFSSTCASSKFCWLKLKSLEELVGVGVGLEVVSTILVSAIDPELGVGRLLAVPNVLTLIWAFKLASLLFGLRKSSGVLSPAGFSEAAILI